MGYASWCKVLGRAVDDGNFLYELEATLRTGTNAKIKRWAKAHANVNLDDNDIEWLKHKVGDTGETYLQIIAMGRDAAGLYGNATLYGPKPTRS